MPFGEPSSNSYGTSSSNSSSSTFNHTMMNRRQSLSETQQQQHSSQPPLRSRQPHATSATATATAVRRSHSPSPSDLLFSHPHSSFDEFPYPPYSELPFTALKRRKQLNAGNQFVKWAMRAVLASPVIVLVLWSIGAMMFSKNVSHRVHRNNNNSNNNNNNNNGMNARMMRRMADNSALLQGAQPVMTPYGLMMPLQQQAQPMLTTNNNNPMGYAMATPQQQQQQQQHAFPSVPMMQSQPQMMQQQQLLQQQGFGMAVPMMQQQQQLQLQAQQSSVGGVPSSNDMAMVAPAYGTTQTSYDLNPMMVLSEIPPPNVADGMPQVMPQAGNGMVVVQPQALQLQQQEQMQQQQQQQMQQGQRMMPPPPASQAEPVPAQSVAATATASQEPPKTRSQQPQQQQQQPKTTILYYDPQQTYMGVNGELRLPTIVYDAQGHALDLASFAAAQDHAQILLEAPIRQAAAPPKRNMEEPLPMGQVEPETVARAVEELSIQESQLSTPTLQKWGASTTQDQNIIVATVAVMALLVGALSARRLRSRSVLSACIENESLEDDVAYDTAYSTTLQDGSSSYNTFGGGAGGWKGDLEKFDV